MDIQRKIAHFTDRFIRAVPVLVLAACAQTGSHSDAQTDNGADGECPQPMVMCNEECIDVSMNHEHCGYCNHACEAYEVCFEGECSVECPSGLTICSGTCRDTSIDPSNCGECGVVCEADLNAVAVCEDGECGLECIAGWSDQDGDGSCESNCVPTDEEQCNGRDDDCDGVVDEGFDCHAGEAVVCTTSCSTNGTGTCTDECTIPGPVLCAPPPELCNGIDDDCDGACDNGLGCCRGTSSGCTTSCGSRGSRTCSDSCVWSACDPPDEVCNDADDDCDGTVDEGFRAQNHDTTYTVLSTIHSGCSLSSEVMGAFCNNAIHHYCQGIDSCFQSGFGPVELLGDNLQVTCVSKAHIRETTFSHLTDIMPPGFPCVSPGTGLNCNGAINRYCQGEGFVSGYGPVECSGDNVAVVCLTEAVRINTTYTELSGEVPICNGTAQSWGTDCNSAIFRFCQAEGPYSSGFGPVEYSGDNVTVVCVRP